MFLQFPNLAGPAFAMVHSLRDPLVVPLQSTDDAEEVLGVWVISRRPHAMQALL
jgi:hypothetical protein